MNKRGGKRDGAGGKKPKLPPDQRRKKEGRRLFNAREKRAVQSAADDSGKPLDTWIREVCLEQAKKQGYSPVK
jgi:hypothetical protein